MSSSSPTKEDASPLQYQPAHQRPAAANDATEAQSAFATTLFHDPEAGADAGTFNKEGGSRGQSRAKTLFASDVALDAQSRGLCGARYAAKAKLLNEALLDVGMGWYQYRLIVVTAVAWFLDYLWMESFLIIAPAAANEAQFFYTYNKEGFLFVSQFVGLAVGALAWPIMADWSGRSWVFTSTIALAGVGGLVGAGMPAFTGLCILGFIVGAAVSGNQAVDAILLLESLPASHQYIVAMQGAAWALGDTASNLIGWTFTQQYTCGTGPDATSTASSFIAESIASSGFELAKGVSSQSSSSCHYVSNKGWRYIWWTFGCITLFCYLVRFAVRIYETPKHLASRSRDAEAAQVVREIAQVNRKSTWVTEAHFAHVNSAVDADRKRRWSLPRFTPRFASLLAIWAIVGVTLPIYRNYITTYLSEHGVPEVTPTEVTTDYLFSRYVYISLCGIPGPLLAGLLIEVPLLGRKRTGAFLACLCGIFMLASTSSRSRGAWLAWQCVLSLVAFAQLSVLTLFTIESLPAPIRGHGLAVAGFTWRALGLVASIVVTFAGTRVAAGAPVWVSGALSIVAALLWLVAPAETRAVAAQ